MSLKSNLKQTLQKSPWLWGLYYGPKTEILRLLKLRYYFYDMRQNYKAMNWSSSSNRATISSELLFQYHKLEKGLVMPGPRRLFGLAPARAAMAIINKCKYISALHEKDSVYLGAIGTLQCYYDRLANEHLDPDNTIIPELKSFLDNHQCERNAFATPCELKTIESKLVSKNDYFSTLMNVRRSVRTFTEAPVPYELLEDAVRISQLSPSVCNRQPVKVTIVSDPELKNKLLSHQNGNAGFGHLAPHIAVIATDANCFFGATERNEPYVDGGLFSMSFILALKAHNVSSCCLNWCVKPKGDKAAHRLLGMDNSLRIIMLIAVGYAPDETYVPRSPRRDLDDVLQFM